MITTDIFEVIFGSYKYITRQLLTDDGVVFNLRYTGYRWKFLNKGNYLVLFLSNFYSFVILFLTLFTVNIIFPLFNSGPRAPPSKIFKEDTSESEEEEGKLPDIVSEVIDISSDSELERSMIELEKAASLEFSESE